MYQMMKGINKLEHFDNLVQKGESTALSRMNIACHLIQRRCTCVTKCSTPDSECHYIHNVLSINLSLTPWNRRSKIILTQLCTHKQTLNMSFPDR
jgi:hypothetical protein